MEVQQWIHHCRSQVFRYQSYLRVRHFIDAIIPIINFTIRANWLTINGSDGFQQMIGGS